VFVAGVRVVEFGSYGALKLSFLYYITLHTVNKCNVATAATTIEGTAVKVILQSHNNFEVRRSNVKIGVSLHSSECQCSIVITTTITAAAARSSGACSNANAIGLQLIGIQLFTVTFFGKIIVYQVAQKCLTGQSAIISRQPIEML